MILHIDRIDSIFLLNSAHVTLSLWTKATWIQYVLRKSIYDAHIQTHMYRRTFHATCFATHMCFVSLDTWEEDSIQIPEHMQKAMVVTSFSLTLDFPSQCPNNGQHRDPEGKRRSFISSFAAHQTQERNERPPSERELFDAGWAASAHTLTHAHARSVTHPRPPRGKEHFEERSRATTRECSPRRVLPSIKAFHTLFFRFVTSMLLSHFSFVPWRIGAFLWFTLQVSERGNPALAYSLPFPLPFPAVCCGAVALARSQKGRAEKRSAVNSFLAFSTDNDDWKWAFFFTFRLKIPIGKYWEADK